MIRFNFLPKFSIIIITSFILFTIIGTLSHELGHIAVAKYFGYETTLDYGSMNYFHKEYQNDNDLKEINRLVKDYDFNNYDDWPESLKSKVEELSESLSEKYPPINEEDVLFISVGGPVQTILSSVIGLLILCVRRKKWKNRFMIVDWLAVFMSLFALREIFNFVQASYSSILYSQSNFHGDEYRISRYLGLNEWVIPSLTLIFGLSISLYVIFKIIPIKYRFSFIVSGLVGGTLGYTIWFGFMGAAIFN